MNEDPRSWVVNESILFPVRGPVTRGVELWTNQYCFLSEDPRSWVVNESILFPVRGPVTRGVESWTNQYCFLSEDPRSWVSRERINTVSCRADWAYAAAACYVASEGTAWKWPNHSLRRLVTPESYKRLVHKNETLANDTSLLSERESG